MTQWQKKRFIRIALYLLLAISAGAAFLLGDRLWASARLGDVPMWAPMLAPCSFTAFVIIYAIDRGMLVRRRLSSLGRASLQVMFALVFLTLLWPQQAAQFRATKSQQKTESSPLERLLRHQDPEVRSAACELAGLRAERSAIALIRPLVDGDPIPSTRQECAQALRRLLAPSEPGL